MPSFDPLDALLYGRDDNEQQDEYHPVTGIQLIHPQNNVNNCSLLPIVNSKGWMVLPPLTWRQDPDVSLSDWKIQVSSNSGPLEEDGVSPAPGTSEEQIYYTHRNVLANASQYFSAIFRQQQQRSMEELRTQTSTFQFHPRACQAFGIMLDYIYSPPLGRSAITPQNAMALRHLAQYLGIPSLLQEVTHILLADMVTLRNHKRYFEDAAIFFDEKIVLALKKQIDLQNTLTDMVQSTFEVLSDDISKFFQEENVHVTCWTTIMKRFDMGNNIYFALQNYEKFPDVLVYGAGLKAVNGIYRLVGSNDGVGRYSNGLFDLIRYRDSDWNICFGYGRSETDESYGMSIEQQSPPEDWEWDWMDMHHIFDCDSETDSPPPDGWKVVEVYEVPDDVRKQMEPAPCILVLPPRKHNSNNDTIQQLFR